MGKLLTILLIFLVPYGTWKVIDFFTPDFCHYTDFRLDQRYYFQRYNSFWYGIYEYPSRKLFEKVYQETPCNNTEQLRETDSSGEHLSISWGINDVLIRWGNDGDWPLEKKVIAGLKSLDEESYEVLVEKNQYTCIRLRQYNKDCSFKSEAQKLRDVGAVPKDYIFMRGSLLDKQLECLEKYEAYPKDKSEIPEQCKAKSLIE